LQTMLFESTPAESTHLEHIEEVYQPKESIPTPTGVWDGFVLHALAFSTLLSSQETDAYTVGHSTIRLSASGAQLPHLHPTISGRSVSNRRIRGPSTPTHQTR
ncbi:hypothetical protein, partial [Streptosporangium saharense]|uniref:hypothetical protein n=1 Tax=Streptosporangium saharense TaxID=1706840 RepID=UPI001C86A49E